MNKNIFVKLVKSPNKQKKFRMNFYIKENDDIRKILSQDFGGVKKNGTPYSDFTIHKDPKKKKNYIARHSKLPNWDNFYTSAGLSRFILWNKETIKESFKDYVERFDLIVLP